MLYRAVFGCDTVKKMAQLQALVADLSTAVAISTVVAICVDLCECVLYRAVFGCDTVKKIAQLQALVANLSTAVAICVDLCVCVEQGCVWV